MSVTKKKTSPKTVLPVAKFKVGQRVYGIIYHKNKPEEVVEGQVIQRTTREFDNVDAEGKKTGVGITFQYLVRTNSTPMLLMEIEVYPNFTDVAKTFATYFLTTLLK